MKRRPETYHAVARNLWAIARVLRDSNTRVLAGESGGEPNFAVLLERVKGRETARGSKADAAILTMRSARTFRGYVDGLLEERILEPWSDGRIAFRSETPEALEQHLAEIFPVAANDASEEKMPPERTATSVTIVDVRAAIREEFERHEARKDEKTGCRRSGTLLFVDFENASRMLFSKLDHIRRRSLELRIEEFCPPVLKAFMLHAFTEARLLSAHRSDGYVLVSCPRLLLNVGDEKDSVDATVRELIRFFCRHEDVSDVVLFAGDHAYAELADVVRREGREFWLVVPRLADPSVSRDLRRAVGDDRIISLKRPSRPISRVKLA